MKQVDLGLIVVAVEIFTPIVLPAERGQPGPTALEIPPRVVKLLAI